MLLIISSISLVALLLVLAVVRYIWATKNTQRLAIKGLEGLKLLIELTKLTQQHRGMHVGFLNGRSEFLPKLSLLESDIKLRIETLLRFESEHSPTQALGIQLISRKWREISENKTLSSVESFRSHSFLIARLLDSLWDIADGFALTSSENREIRLLAMQFVKTVPELTESLGQIRALSVQVASQKEISADKKLQLLYIHSRIEKRITSLDQDFPETSLALLTSFLERVKVSTENQDLSHQNPDNLFQDATLVIDDLFRYIYGGFTRIQARIIQ